MPRSPRRQLHPPSPPWRWLQTNEEVGSRGRQHGWLSFNTLEAISWSSRNDTTPSFADIVLAEGFGSPPSLALKSPRAMVDILRRRVPRAKEAKDGLPSEARGERGGGPPSLALSSRASYGGHPSPASSPSEGWCRYGVTSKVGTFLSPELPVSLSLTDSAGLRSDRRGSRDAPARSSRPSPRRRRSG